MATTFKNFLSNDYANTRTLLHEAIPITGSIISGTYSGNHVKTYGHGMFDSVYDYPYLSSSANQIFDMTVGYSTNSHLSSSSNTQNAKKINIYNQMAQYLVGYDTTGSIKKFTMPTGSTSVELSEVFFVPFSRLLTKDEIKKGSFSMDIGVKPAFTEEGAMFTNRISLTDASGSNGYYVDSPAGEYGILYATGAGGADTLYGTDKFSVGLLYYQAGVAVITGSIFNDTDDEGILATSLGTSAMLLASPASYHGFNFLSASTISTCASALRSRIQNVSFNNTTELNSTIYFCRISHNDFNYSSNPTYLSASQIRVKTSATDTPVSYLTTVGLYSADNELMAVAKLSEPLRKDPTNEITLRVRLDY